MHYRYKLYKSWYFSSTITNYSQALVLALFTQKIMFQQPSGYPRCNYRLKHADPASVLQLITNFSSIKVGTCQ